MPRKNESDESRMRRWKKSAVAFVQEVIGPDKIEPEQLQILNAITNHTRVAIRSGHGIGKTTAISWAVLWFLCTRKDCRIPCTAPTRAQLSDILWAEISKWIMTSELLKMKLEWTKSRIQVVENPDDWFAVARTANKPENLQGFHAQHLMFVIDEAPGVSESIMNVVEGALTGSDNRIIMVGNPTRISGTFHKAFHQDKAIWKTLHFSSEDSALVSKSFITRMEKHGRDSDVFKVRVLGEFPSGDPDTLIQLWMVDAAIGREDVPDSGKAFIGVDPARFGNDESVIAWRRGDVLKEIRAFHGIDTQRQAGEVRRLAREIWAGGYEGSIEVRVDDTGVGGGVTDALQGAEGLIICPINFGGKARNEDYCDFGAQMWGHLKQVMLDISLPKDDELLAQLTSRKYGLDKDGKIRMERKEDMKKRGLPSPDRADAVALCFAEVRSDPFEANSTNVLTGKRDVTEARSQRRGFDDFGIDSGSGRLGD